MKHVTWPKPVSPMTEHGITTSDAHYWLHVSPFNQAVYVYRRESMLKALESGQFRTKEIASAFGFIVPTVQRFIWRFDWDCGGEEWRAAQSDAAVGKRAEIVAESWMSYPANLCHLRGDAVALLGCRYATTLAEQIKHDYTIRAMVDIRIEVKADVRAAQTGNLFVQTHERHHAWSERNGHLVVA